ncbi:MAG: hypothetical protein A1D16_11305 [Flavihumibacter sp. CACIAM 22H1]|nr:MAG: hypothetical protein A1D16_11305 [Flavihumibacter sp. CACIAM 22H1]
MFISTSFIVLEPASRLDYSDFGGRSQQVFPTAQLAETLDPPAFQPIVAENQASKGFQGICFAQEMHMRAFTREKPVA